MSGPTNHPDVTTWRGGASGVVKLVRGRVVGPVGGGGDLLPAPGARGGPAAAGIPGEGHGNGRLPFVSARILLLDEPLLKRPGSSSASRVRYVKGMVLLSLVFRDSSVEVASGSDVGGLLCPFCKKAIHPWATANAVPVLLVEPPSHNPSVSGLALTPSFPSLRRHLAQY